MFAEGIDNPFFSGDKREFISELTNFFAIYRKEVIVSEIFRYYLFRS